MSLAYGDTRSSLENRKSFLSKLGIDYHNLVCARQVHGVHPRYIREDDKGKGAVSGDTALADTDALITDKRNLPLAIFTADCLSIFLYDPIRLSIGIIHAGWQGSKENIALKTVQLMQEKFNTRPQDLYVGFGPVIRQCCYEVGEEFSDCFADSLTKKNSHYYLDLAGINKKQLLGLGVSDINIFDSKICTSCQNDEYFSFRKEGNNCGRMMSVIMLR
jgi:hypothetical protein